MKIKDQITIRLIDPEKDFKFILDSWLQSNRLSESSYNIPTDTYYKHHRAYVEHALTGATNSTTVLCDPQDPDTILGYVVYSTIKPIIYYMYVRKPFRRLGLGRLLLEGVRRDFGDAETVICTHLPRRSKTQRKWRKLASDLNLSYNPYIVSGEMLCEEKT